MSSSSNNNATTSQDHGSHSGSSSNPTGNAREMRNRSYAIDKMLEQDSKQFRKECKILLLGSGESGKSTVVKQMKIIHQNGYSKDELLLFKVTVYKNVMDSAQGLVVAMRKFKFEPLEPVNRVYADRILDYRIDSDPSQALSDEIVRAIESLWHDPIIPTVLDRTSEFYLMDSATYFFDEVQRIGAADYVPNESDVLRARTKTTGISETKFKSGQLSIHMFDVGGQRSERKKVDTLFRSRYIHHLLRSAQRIRSSIVGGERAESYGRKSSTVRKRHQFPVVCTDVYHSLPQ